MDGGYASCAFVAEDVGCVAVGIGIVQAPMLAIVNCRQTTSTLSRSTKRISTAQNPHSQHLQTGPSRNSPSTHTHTYPLPSPSHTTMSTLELSGFCHISQGESHLDDFQGNAVTTRGPNPTWKISLVNPEHLIGSHIVTIALVTELGDPAAPLVLTLGEKVEQEGIQIVVAPLETPPSPRQMWTLEDVLPTKR